MTIVGSWGRKASPPRVEDVLGDLLDLNFIRENIKNTVKARPVLHLIHSGERRYKMALLLSSPVL